MADAHSPLAQFEIKTIAELQPFGIDASFTNASLIMVVVVGLITLFIVAGMNKATIVPGRFQGMVEFFYEFIANLLQENTGPKGKQFFPLVFSLFMFILGCNLIGLFGVFTVTSHIIVTFALALMVITIVTVVGFIRHGGHFLTYFVPQGAPMWLMPLMIPLEVISYLIRPISLSVRLFANMVAGHVMLGVIGTFVVGLGSLFFAFGAIPLAAIPLIFALEVLVALLQAYVFAILTCIYLNDAIHLAH
ncbi:MAG: F0F1 ATP synthase subunit A [Rhodospirillaceae bacterium]|nr:F0F1 ATP synthase subunit A [Rhodospirillaceae bacterium]